MNIETTFFIRAQIAQPPFLVSHSVDGGVRELHFDTMDNAMRAYTELAHALSSPDQMINQSVTRQIWGQEGMTLTLEPHLYTRTTTTQALLDLPYTSGLYSKLARE